MKFHLFDGLFLRHKKLPSQRFLLGFLRLFGRCFAAALFFNNLSDYLERKLLEMCFRLAHYNSLGSPRR